MKPSVFRWLTVGIASYLGWLLVNLAVVVLFPFLLGVERFGGPAGIGLVRRGFAASFRLFFLRFFSLIRVYRVRELPDAKRLQAARPAVFVANHRSWLDPLLIYALIPDVLIPVDISYTRVPLARSAMRWLGAVPFDRRNREMMHRSVIEMKQALKEGRPVAAFPEGTRSPMGTLGSFSDIFFHIAVEEEVPIAPLLLHLSHPFLGPGNENFLTARRADLTIQLLEAVQPVRGDRGADLTRYVYRKMAAGLACLDGTEG